DRDDARAGDARHHDGGERRAGDGALGRPGAREARDRAAFRGRARRARRDVRAHREGKQGTLPVDAPAGSRLSEEAPVPAPPASDGSRKRLASRLIGLGAIPILVFCGVYLVASRIFGLDSPQGQAYTLVAGLAGAVASLFTLAFLASRAAVG